MEGQLLVRRSGGRFRETDIISVDFAATTGFHSVPPAVRGDKIRYGALKRSRRRTQIFPDFICCPTRRRDCLRVLVKVYIVGKMKMSVNAVQYPRRPSGLVGNLHTCW